MKCKDCNDFNKDTRYCINGACYGYRDPEQDCVIKDGKAFSRIPVFIVSPTGKRIVDMPSVAACAVEMNYSVTTINKACKDHTPLRYKGQEVYVCRFDLD